MKKQLPETHKRTFFVIEVAPNLYLTCYAQGGAYCASRTIFYRPCEEWPHVEYLENKDEFLSKTPRLYSHEDCIKYIEKCGTMEDFLSWCKDLQKEYSGDGKPRIRKVTATLSVDIGDAEELLP